MNLEYRLGFISHNNEMFNSSKLAHAIDPVSADLYWSPVFERRVYMFTSIVLI
jgi:hypothetical protein